MLLNTSLQNVLCCLFPIDCQLCCNGVRTDTANNLQSLEKYSINTEQSFAFTKMKQLCVYQPHKLYTAVCITLSVAL